MFSSAPAFFLSSLQSVQFECIDLFGVQGCSVHKHAVAGVSACLAISYLIWFQGPIQGFAST